ncbi:hypothetical protein Back2_24570 [Nocardioides baekrokdamisoli]|uniref:Uncharacterized protein n=1 Tax=Nocardioides baekrokdamisoli TaxID=1804624 RepID=A0A3G9IGJ4_9ACTN|nr:hypothetical protein [Nocardioides baekrokdamisoli]BBH18170.1 hypothetical protein Back2_24570 [Nocardioides baekrokdamisoli]
MDADFLPLGDPAWRDAYLIGGELRLTEVAIASLTAHRRLYETDGVLSVRRGDHLKPEETIQRVVLNLISLEPRATAALIAKQVPKTEPVLAIERELTDAGLVKRQLGRLKPTADGKAASAQLIGANAQLRGVRGVAYNGPTAAGS